MVQETKNREEIPIVDTWALEDIFASDELWNVEYEDLQNTHQVMASYQGKLEKDGMQLLSYLRQKETLNTRLELLGKYCTQRLDQDTRNAFYQEMVGKYRDLCIRIDAGISFEKAEIMRISDQELENFYEDYPELERYRRFLTVYRRKKAHFLSAAEEKLLVSAGEMSHTPAAVFGAFMDADLKYPDAVDSQGCKYPVTKGSFIALQNSADRVLRESTYKSFYQTIGMFRNTAASMLNAQHKQLDFFAKARNYSSAFAEALDNNQIPQQVYFNLIEAVHANLDKMHRYVRLRKKILNVDELHFYDVHASLVPDAVRRIPFSEAKDTVYRALSVMGPEYQSILMQGFQNRWIDVYENAGKRGGAYSSGSSVHPFILLNYNETLKSQFTLAHEMGHALHSYYSNREQNPFDSRYSIFVAEVASTCNESLLMHYLLERTTDKRERAALLNHFLEQFKGIIYRQAMFAEFEYLIGCHAAEGNTLTARYLCGEYRRLNEEYFGPDMIVDDEISMEWARIPHFYYNYYVYQYATGFSAAIALSRRILHGGVPAVQDYLRFLSSGCLKPPIELLKNAGVDMTDTKPITDALQMFDELMDEFETLLEE